VRALLLVDLQNDFMPGGALAVEQGDAVVPVANRLAPHFPLVVASQDWHPADHASFAANHPGKRPGDHVVLDGLDQVLWPRHCVQHTFGAELVSSLRRERVHAVFPKGTESRLDSYSALFDNAHRRATGLGDWLSERSVSKLVVLGLATDYCVLHTVLDAAGLGFRVLVVEDGCRGVGLARGDVERAWIRMREAGASVVRADALCP